jgi:hypothetical protein
LPALSVAVPIALWSAPSSSRTVSSDLSCTPDRRSLAA